MLIKNTLKHFNNIKTMIMINKIRTNFLKIVLIKNKSFKGKYAINNK